MNVPVFIGRSEMPAVSTAISGQHLATDAVQDELLSELSSIAYTVPATPKVLAAKPVTTKRKSRFFFRLTASWEQEVSARERQVKALRKTKTPSPLTREMAKRRTGYKQELPVSLRKNINKVREYFLNELAPLLLASNAGVTQAQHIIQTTVNSPIDTRAFNQFEQMLQAAAQVSMAQFITSYLGLPKSVADDLVSKFIPKREVLIVGNDERRASKRDRLREQMANEPAPREPPEKV